MTDSPPWLGGQVPGVRPAANTGVFNASAAVSPASPAGPAGPASQHDQPAHDAGPADMPAPPVVYLPVRTDGEGNVTDIAMIRLGDGRVALLAYTALDRFIDCCGPEQPWLLFFTHALGEIHAEKPFDVKMLDVMVPEDFRPLLRAATA